MKAHDPLAGEDPSVLASSFREIYLSPHLDDVVFSSGGRISSGTRAGGSALVVTVMAGDPPDGPLSPVASKIHALWEVGEGAVAARRAEDIAACAVLGARTLHWPLPDCIYRRDPKTNLPLYRHAKETFRKVRPEHSREILPRLELLMRTLPRAETVFAPLGLGGHVDHRLTRLAAESVFGEALCYYEDFPYAFGPEGKRLLGRMKSGWSSEITPLSEIDLETKIAASSRYASQIPAIFGSVSEMTEQVRSWARTSGGGEDMAARLSGRRERPVVEAMKVAALLGWYRREKAGARSWLRRHFYRLTPYRRDPTSPEVAESQYRGGGWDGLRDLDELARYAVIAGYVRRLKPGAVVLDLGCGEGLLCEQIRGAYSNYTGVDFSGEATRRATAREDEHARFVRADAREYVPDPPADVIVFNETLYYVEKPLEMVRRYEPFLRESGFVVVSQFVAAHALHTWDALGRRYAVRDEVRLVHRNGKEWIVKVLAPRSPVAE